MSSATLEGPSIADWTAIARRLGPDFAARAAVEG